MVRAVKTGVEELDGELIRIQHTGGKIIQVLPCPMAVSMEGWEDRKGRNGLSGEIDMYFMVTYDATD